MIIHIFQKYQVPLKKLYLYSGNKVQIGNSIYATLLHLQTKPYFNPAQEKKINDKRTPVWCSLISTSTTMYSILIDD